MKTHLNLTIYVEDEPQFRFTPLSTGSEVLMLGPLGDAIACIHFTQPKTVENLRALRDLIDTRLHELDPDGEAASLIVDGADQVFRTGYPPRVVD